VGHHRRQQGQSGGWTHPRKLESGRLWASPGSSCQHGAKVPRRSPSGRLALLPASPKALVESPGPQPGVAAPATLTDGHLSQPWEAASDRLAGGQLRHHPRDFPFQASLEGPARRGGPQQAPRGQGQGPAGGRSSRFQGEATAANPSQGPPARTQAGRTAGASSPGPLPALNSGLQGTAAAAAAATGVAAGAETVAAYPSGRRSVGRASLGSLLCRGNSADLPFALGVFLRLNPGSPSESDEDPQPKQAAPPGIVGAGWEGERVGRKRGREGRRGEARHIGVPQAPVGALAVEQRRRTGGCRGLQGVGVGLEGRAGVHLGPQSQPRGGTAGRARSDGALASCHQAQEEGRGSSGCTRVRPARPPCQRPAAACAPLAPAATPQQARARRKPAGAQEQGCCRAHSEGA